MAQSKKKIRIDLLLVERGLVESRHRAQALILAGHVLANEQKIEKPGQTVDPESIIRILEKLPFVSRGGLKLQEALDQFHISVSDRVCADLGSSTGGFTDCLLQRGAQAVHAFDVGKGILDWKLQSDRRVIPHEEFNVRFLTAADFPRDISLVAVDLSFISATKILGPLMSALAAVDSASVDIIVLVKPQFEVGKGEVGKGGIVRDGQKRARALESVIQFAVTSGFQVVGSIPSPIVGAKGNVEFLLYLRLVRDLSSST